MAGLVPGPGIFPDLLNAGISLCRGSYVEAGFSLFAAIPIAGDAAGAGKLA
ncbi:filamentous hemagglutinin, partial [Salmonella enterica subsp. enterica serovar Kentucky]|nr:filamentous hemagglutinin [Salmonella enterica subsp. enterica serovar Kentucky]